MFSVAQTPYGSWLITMVTSPSHLFRDTKAAKNIPDPNMLSFIAELFIPSGNYKWSPYVKWWKEGQVSCSSSSSGPVRWIILSSHPGRTYVSAVSSTIHLTIPDVIKITLTHAHCQLNYLENLWERSCCFQQVQ